MEKEFHLAMTHESMAMEREFRLACTCGSQAAKWKCEVVAQLELSCALRCLCACLFCFLHARQCAFHVLRSFRYSLGQGSREGVLFLATA